MNKCNRVVGLNTFISRKHLLTIYKTFVRSHLDYADRIYDKPFNDSFKEKLVQKKFNTLQHSLLHEQ